MTHSNISIFVPHMGCPHTCSFCNQRTISSTERPPSPDDVRNIIGTQFERISDISRRKETEIAFFGGSFTAIDEGYRRQLLEAAFPFTEKARTDGFRGIRISTRPDCISDEILDELSRYGVTSIELGAQSMSDRVLQMNERGHTADDVRRSSEMIRSRGFELGLQMMVGLYGSTREDEYRTMTEIIKISPDTVRIYPVSVLRGTRLAELYESGEYKLYSFDECVNICAMIYWAFRSVDIRVIRMGLHAEDSVGGSAVAGFYHPAFAEIVRSKIVRDNIEKYYESECRIGDALEVSANKSLIGAVYGHKKSNRLYFSKVGMNVKISEDNSLAPDTLSINKEVRNVFKIT